MQVHSKLISRMVFNSILLMREPLQLIHTLALQVKRYILSPIFSVVYKHIVAVYSIGLHIGENYFLETCLIDIFATLPAASCSKIML